LPRPAIQATPYALASHQTKGSLIGTIQANNEMTFYSKQGDFIARIAQFIAVLFFTIGLVVRKGEQ